MANKLRKVVYSVATFAIVLGSVFAFSTPKVSAAAPAYDYAIANQSSYPATLAPGATTNVWIEVKNTGTAVWGDSVRLGTGSSYGAANQQRDYTSEFYDASTWLSANRAANMTDGTRRVSGIQPGWHVRYQFNIKAPTTPGTYKAYFTPVVDGVSWMKDMGIYWQIKVADDGTGTVDPGNGTTNGDITLSIPSSTPAATTVLKGATGVDVLKFTVKSSATINDINVKRTGVGSSSDFVNVYLYDGNTRLTNGRSISSDTNIASFYNLGLNATNGRTLTVKADVSADAGTSNQSKFEISKVNATDFVDGDGNTMTIGSQTMGAVTISASGSLSANLGQAGAEVAKFTINAGSATNDVVLRGITLRNSGILSNSYINSLKLLAASNEIASVSSMSGDKAVFTLSTPYTIAKGTIKTMSVLANLTGGRVNDTISFYLDYDADLNLTDSVYGFGTKLTNSWASGDQSLSLTGSAITLAFNGPEVTTFAKNTTQNLFTDASITSSRNITVRKAKVIISSFNGALETNTDYIDTDVDNDGVLDGGDGDIDGNNDGDVNDDATTNYEYIKNIRIVDLTTGNTIAGPMSKANDGTWTGGAGYTKEFTDQFDVTAGQTRRLGIKADIDNNFATSGRTVSMTLDLSGLSYVYVYDNDSSAYVSNTDIVPNSISGNTMNLGSDSMTVAMASTPSTGTTSKGMTNVSSVGYIFKSGDTNSTKVSKIVFKGQATLGAGYTTGNLDDLIAAANLYVDGTKVNSSAVSVSSAGVITFTGLNIAIPAGSSKRVELYTDIRSTAGTDNDDAFWVGIADPSDITAENGSGNTFDVTADDGTWSANEDNSGSAVLINVRTGGSLNMVLDSSSPLSKVVVAGSTNNEALRVKFTAQYEDYTVKKLKFGVDVNNDGVVESTSDNNISSITLTDGTTSYTQYVSGGSVSFTGMNFTVLKDSNKVLMAKINYKTISAGATSGEKIELIAYGTASNGFEATGKSGTTITRATNNADVTTGGTMVVRKTQPTISNVSQSSSKLSNTQLDLASFTVAADSGADVAFKRFTFDASATTGVAISSGTIKLYKNGSEVLPANYTVKTADTFANLAAGNDAFIDSEKFIMVTYAASKEEVVSAGSSATFTLRGNVTGADTGDSLLVRLADEGSIADSAVSTYTSANAVTAGAYMIWSDNSDISHSDTTVDWTSGNLLETLPTNYFSYSY